MVEILDISVMYNVTLLNFNPSFRVFRKLSIYFLEDNIKHTLSNKAVVIDAIRIEFIVS